MTERVEQGRRSLNSVLSLVFGPVFVLTPEMFHASLPSVTSLVSFTFTPPTLLSYVSAGDSLPLPLPLAASTPTTPTSAITSIEFGELSELPSSTDIMKILECPVCKEIPYPPIFNCTSGHSVCGTCRPKLTNCALCKADYTEGRNYSLESLVRSSKFLCHYKDRGCSCVVTGENYREHLRHCAYRPGCSSSTLSSDVMSEKYKSADQAIRGGDQNQNNSGGTSTSSSEHAGFEFVAWIKCKNGQYPAENAVVAGYSAGSPVFIARAYHGTRLIMGRLLPSEKAAYIYWPGLPKKWYYEVLVSVPNTVKWVEASWGDVPENAVSGGQSPDLENVYVGRALRNGQYVPGFVQPTCQGCYIGVGHQLYLCHDYQVLVFNIERT